MLDVGRPLIDEKAIEKNVTKEEPIDRDEDRGEEIVGLKESKGPNLITVFSVIILVLFIGMSVALFLVKLSKSSTLKNKQEAYDRLETQLKSKELADVNKQAENLGLGLDKIKGVLANRSSYSSLLKKLFSLVPDEMRFNDLSIDDKFHITISGETADYNSVALFLAALKTSDMFSNVKLESTGYSEATATSFSEDSEEIITSGVTDFSLSFDVDKNKINAE